MNILVIGGGGREHALCKTFKKSKQAKDIYVSPGNPGIAGDVLCVSLIDTCAIIEFVKHKDINLVFVGPEQPLAAGLVNDLLAAGIKVIGPTKEAARIESSKAFAKELMRANNIPTAAYAIFNDCQSALTYLKNCAYPCVIKADGLAAGKGVIIVDDYAVATQTIKDIMQDALFGTAGDQVIIEAFLTGWEVSVFAFCDGENFVSTIFAQDHKQIFDGDKGPNTGGMGAYAPVKSAQKYHPQIDKEIFALTLKAMKDAGCPFTGVLFAGLMITADGPQVIEFNCRLGDPETEVILPLLKTDLVEVCTAITNKQIDKLNLTWEDAYAVTVCAACGGYPDKYETGKVIELTLPIKGQVYYAGVRRENDKLVTNGGRVLMLTSIENSLDEAIKCAYVDIKKIKFAGMYYRNDIGHKGL